MRPARPDEPQSSARISGKEFGAPARRATIAAVVPAEFVHRGRLLVEDADYKEAVRVCRLGLLANPAEIEGRLVLGEALMALSRHDEVLAEMRAALEIDPGNAAAARLKEEARARGEEERQSRELLPLVSSDDDTASLPIRSALPGTVDIDPEREGIEMRDSEELSGADELELSSDDLEFIEEDDDEVERSGAPVAAGDAPVGASTLKHRGLERGAPFEDRRGPSHDDDLAPSVDFPLPMRSLRGPDYATQSGFIGGGEEEASDGPALDELFPYDERGVSGLLDVEGAAARAWEPMEGPEDGDRPQRSMTEDMRTIRQGLGLPEEVRLQAAAPAEAAPSRAPETRQARIPTPEPAAAARPRRALAFALYPLVALVVIGAGIYGGFELRAARLSRDIRAARAEAASLAATDTYAGYRGARDVYRRIADASGETSARAALSRAEAALVFEFADEPSAARAALESLGPPEGSDAWAASAFLALAGGDLVAAETAAAKLAAARPGDPLAPYLKGRIALARGDASAAAADLERATDAELRPLVGVSQGRALALGGDLKTAIATYDRVLEAAPGHPFALIFRTRAASLLAPEDSRDSDALEALAAFSAGESVSAAEVAWAALVTAEIAERRGDAEAASQQAALAASRPPAGDIPFALSLATLYAKLGQPAKASAALAALGSTPGAAAARAQSARSALEGGDPSAALATLGNESEPSPEVLALRGRAHLVLGDLEAAAADLDAALALEPERADARIARAQIDVEKGDPQAAITRLGALATTEGSASAAALTYAAALRGVDRRGEGREVLEAWIGAEKAEPQAPALLELARLEREVGELKTAAELLDRAETAAAKEPSALSFAASIALERARLALASGDTGGAREKIDALVAETPGRADILIEAARIHTETGDAEGAAPLLESASELPGALEWRLARERARIALRRQLPVVAKTALADAIAARPRDLELRLMLLDANLDAHDREGAEAARDSIAEIFPASPLLATAAGVVSLLEGDSAAAKKSLESAYEALAERPVARAQLAQVAYWIGRAAELAAETAEASKWLQLAASLEPTRADAHYWLGQAAFVDQKLELAVREYQAAVALDPGAHPMAWYFLGVEWERQKNKKRAKEAFSEFLDRSGASFADQRAEVQARLKALRR